MIRDEKKELAVKLAKEYYGDNYLVALWGSASVLLTEKDLDIIVKVMESNKWVPMYQLNQYVVRLALA